MVSISGVVKFAILIIVLGLIGFFTFKIYPQAMANQIYAKVNGSSEIAQFAPNLRFADSRISYFINPNCPKERIQNMLEAFRIIANRTKIIEFYSSTEKYADIVVGCSKDSYEQEKNVFAAGEGGPTAYLNLSYYPLIKRGKVILYEKSQCNSPIIELHELLHVFGFEHVNNQSSIMYPYAICDSVIDTKIIEILQDIYSVKPLAELLFESASASKSGMYLNFEFEISNQGLSDAEKINVEVWANNTQLKPVDIDSIEVGQTQTVRIKNMLLPSREISTIKLVIDYNRGEFDKQNNEIVLNI